MTIVEDRHARQRLIPGWDQARISAATAVIVGVGALGNEVAKNLALLGFGRLILCDRDVVSTSNLSRTVLFGGADVGRPKAQAAAGPLAALAPGLDIVVRNEDLVRGVGLGELADADVVLGCLDSRRARLQLLGRCALIGATLVDGGTHPWGGEVRLRVAPDEPCYGCTLTPAQRAASDTPASCDELTDEPLPASILSTSLVAGWMAVTAARQALGQPVPWRFLSVDAAVGDTAVVQAELDPACPHHVPIGPVERVRLGRDATVGGLLSVLPPDADPLSWMTFPLPGDCYHCHSRYRVGYSARDPVVACTQCGGWVRPPRTQSLREAAVETPLAQLGIAPHEVLAVRLTHGDYRWLRLE